MTHRGRRQGITLSAAALAASVAVTTAAPGTAFAAPDKRPQRVPAAGDAHDHLPDVDVRNAKVAPSAAQRAASAPGSNKRGSSGGAITWNRFGSVGAVTPSGTTPLATGPGTNPLAAARAYLNKNAAAFRRPTETPRPCGSPRPMRTVAH